MGVAGIRPMFGCCKQKLSSNQPSMHLMLWKPGQSSEQHLYALADTSCCVLGDVHSSAE